MDVRREYIENLLQLVSAQGFDAATLFQQAGLTPPNDEHSDEFQLNAEDFSKLYTCATQMAGDECFGFFGAGHVPAGTFDMLCHYLLPANTLGQALKRAARFYDWMEHLQHRKANIRSFEPYTVHDGVTEAYFINQSSPASPVFIHQRSIATGMASWHRFLCWLIGVHIPLLEVHLQGRCQLDEATCERVFNAPVKFQQQANALVFSEQFVNARVAHNSQSLNNFLKLAPYHLVATRERDSNEESLTNRIKNVLGSDFTSKPPGIDQAAVLLNMSSRTLRRVLEREGTSFQRIKDECRLQGAIRLLGENSLSIAQIAEKMGFDEPSAFHRAFKKWTGITPGIYRERLLS